MAAPDAAAPAADAAFALLTAELPNVEPAFAMPVVRILAPPIAANVPF